MYEEFNNQNLELQLLYAKDAIFRLISQFHHASDLFDDGNLYIQNYCESALEAAFETLGIEDNYIPLWDFCVMWENNNRALWGYNAPDEPYGGITADIHYECFKDEYESWQRTLEEIANEDS